MDALKEKLTDLYRSGFRAGKAAGEAERKYLREQWDDAEVEVEGLRVRLNSANEILATRMDNPREKLRLLRGALLGEVTE